MTTAHSLVVVVVVVVRNFGKFTGFEYNGDRQRQYLELTVHASAPTRRRAVECRVVVAPDPVLAVIFSSDSEKQNNSLSPANICSRHLVAAAVVPPRCGPMLRVGAAAG